MAFVTEILLTVPEFVSHARQTFYSYEKLVPFEILVQHRYWDCYKVETDATVPGHQGSILHIVIENHSKTLC